MSPASNTPSRYQILDACCGGRMWWWDKKHPLAVYMDNRVVPREHEPEIGSDKRHGSGSWACEPDLIGDFRAMPFEDGTFQLVLFDPPHVIRDEIKGHVTLQYGALPKASADDDLRRGFTECWRVLSAGGTLVFKWAGDPVRVRPHFPANPIVGTKVVRGGKGLGTRWFIFYKALPASLGVIEDYLQEALVV